MYAAELDDRRQEVRAGSAANTLRAWPKVAGVGNVVATAATYAIKSPKGAALTSGTATRTTVASVTRIDVPVDASALELGENYAAIITWSYDGASYVSTVRFDVVTEPWDGADLSLNDLVDEVATIGEVLTAIIAGKGDTDRTTDQEASLLGVKACTEVKGWIRSSLESRGRIYPRLILQREELRAVIAAQAIARAYRSLGGGADAASRARADEWTAEAQRRLQALGELDYDADDDGTPDATLSGFGTVRLGRSWT